MCQITQLGTRSLYIPETVQTQTLKSELPQTLEKQESACELCGLARL